MSSARCEPNTRMVWIETPSNPLLKMIDLAAVAKIARDARCDLGFRQHLCQPVDSAADRVRLRHGDSFRDEISQRPFRHGRRRRCRRGKQGAGRSDAFLQNSVGAIAGPFDSFLAMRGLKTLALRMERHCENALEDRGLAARSNRKCEKVQISRSDECIRNTNSRETQMRWLRRNGHDRFGYRSGRHAAFSREHASVLARRKSGWRRKPDESSCRS